MRILVSAAAAILAAVLPLSSPAQEYPTRSVKIIVTLAPGGTADILARLLAEKLSSAWGQPVVVENRPGASGMIGAEAVAKAEPDGYTLLMGYNAEIAINPSIFRSMSYDPRKAFTPVTIVGTTPMLLVIHPSIPAKSLQELIDLARSGRAKLSYGSAGNGSTPHLGAEMLKNGARIDLTHVPFKSAALAIPQVIGNHVSMVFSGMPLAMPHVRAGSLRAIAVSSTTRSTAAPDVPTMAESGFPDFDITNWFGIFVPAGTPAPIVDKLYADIARSVKAEDMVARLRREGGDINPLPPKEFARFIEAEAIKYQKIVRESGITAD
ncbi:MAG: tripartite tricarboxylate transporter substrate binding protein [Burkholderiales bacterium]|nr:tripartite tricarboxylate transporter substrate binding protein [Burkholderiales bacterium]GIK86796.1 MAG: exported protein [Betaproteobacteria bacterium]